MFQTEQRKTAPPFGRFTPPLTGSFFTALFFVYCGANFEVATVFGQRKKIANLDGLLCYIFTQ
jgi:hypothetical protein